MQVAHWKDTFREKENESAWQGREKKTKYGCCLDSSLVITLTHGLAHKLHEKCESFLP